MEIQEEAKMGGVTDEVDMLFNKVVALEGNVQEGIGAEDKEFVVLIELLMMQMLKLDEIEAEGELKVERKRETWKSLFYSASCLKNKQSNDVFESFTYRSVVSRALWNR